ncbi:protein serine/threonine phosphatase [Rhodopirellula maiorica SM1]|uniref:Protein serine/threonine phosphatase n=1 Tax=Rhodopirellula maiorica SM1 TaxID=1265738 RepID=M5RFM0_9BACT|nr:protein phosphatase 2C domain-containing protein [Rhodopirellula maiorica]EMI18165.1 protein serine/threonine phosphatase [Rhodopirellula maiorica SM1]
MNGAPFDISGGSDIGKKRSENQDHFLIADLRRQLIVRGTDVPDAKHREMFGCQEGNLLVIADGMGGHRDGERASRTAIESTAQYVLDMMHWFLKLCSDEEQDFIDELSHSLTAIQQKIWTEGEGVHRRMGTTVTMAYLLGSRMYVVHAGDSRCYMLRDKTLKQLTTDHTVAQQLIDAGALRDSDAAIEQWRHVLWNCVGGGNQAVRPEAVRSKLQTGDILLLCSDGLTGMVDEDRIASILMASKDSESSVAKLIEAANDAGGADNISAIVCRINQVEDHCDTSIAAELDTTTG